eukprot:gb/GECH01014768.1/.p1 GENE.gb/GECH01014768.1/~~gb/GECH01014768.1/.p1  ORF type:complete len:307 (+),score=81.51 gb/GECH01014768.1/:1-921(+)
MNNQIDVNNEPDIITLSPIKQSPTIESSGKEQTTRKIQQKFHSPLFSPKNYSTLDSPNNLYCVLKKLNYYSPSNNSSEMVSKLESGHLSEDKQNMTLPKNSHHPTESNMTHYYECNSPAHHKQVSFMTDVDDFHSCGSEEDDHDEKHDQNQKNAPGNPNSFLSPSQRAMMNHRIQSSGVDSYLNATGEGISPYQFRVEKNSTTVTPGTHDKRSSLRPTFHTPGPVSFTSFGVAGGEGSQIPDLDALNSDSVNISCDEKNKRHVRGIGNSSGSQAEDYRDVNRDAEYERQLSQVRKEKTTRCKCIIS